MMTVNEVKRWLRQFHKDARIGVDEGGLTLCAILPDGQLSDYLEIGGIPERADAQLKFSHTCDEIERLTKDA